MWHKRFRPIVLGLHDYSSTCSTNNYDAIIHHFGSFFHKNPPLNKDLPIILIFLILYNITFGLSHPHKIDYRVYMPHKNKITNKQVTKKHVAVLLKERCLKWVWNINYNKSKCICHLLTCHFESHNLKP